MTNDKELIKRLRRAAAIRPELRTPHIEDESLTAILIRERIVEGELMEDAASRLSSLQAENEAMREALKPFAALANKFSDSGHSDDWHIGGRHKTEPQSRDIRLGDLRRARSALSESKG